MKGNHLSDTEIQGVARGESAAIRRWLEHVVQDGCDECLAASQLLLEAVLLDAEIGEAFEPDEREEELSRNLPRVGAVALDTESMREPSAEYDVAVARAEDSVRKQVAGIGRRQKRAEQCLADMKARSLPITLQGLYRLSESQARRLMGWPGIEVLLQEAHSLRYSSPRSMQALLHLAGIEARSLSPKLYGPRLVADFQARVLIEQANGHRIVDEFDAADRALAEADRLYSGGTGDILLLARLLDITASVRVDQQRFPEAFARLRDVEELYREAGDLHLAGRALVKCGSYSIYAGDPRRALECFTQAKKLLDPKRDPKLVHSCRLNLLRALIDCEHFDEAARFHLEITDDLRRAFATEPLNIAKLRWNEGLMFAGLDEDLLAEEAFEDARPVFLKHRRNLDAARVGLDLADLWLRQGRAQEVAELTRELITTFDSLKIHREAIVALRYLQEACRYQRSATEALHRVRAFLRELERTPGLPFTTQ